MARALVTYERQADGGWRPTVAWLGTPKRLDARALPGDGARDAWMAGVLAQAHPPYLDSGEQGTWEDWIGWALNALANAHDTWATEVQPAPTVDAIYVREILEAPAQRLSPARIEPSAVVPEGLEGYRKVKPAR